MFLWSALVIGLTSVGQAFLLPPTVSSVDSDIIKSLPFEVKSTAESRTLKLECKRCPVPTGQHSEIEWTTDVESKLNLRFEIVENEFDTLKLNGVQIYPPHGLPLEPIGAPQLTEVTDSDDHMVFLNLGYELNVTPVMKSEDDQLELILIRLQIIEVAGIFVDGIDRVILKILKTQNGKLLIGDLGVGPTINPGGKNCQTIMCHLRKIVTNKLSHSKPNKGCSSNADTAGAHPHGHDGHGSGHGAHHHHRPYVLSQILHNLKRAAFHVLIPVLIGIGVGFTASFLGMLVGQIVVFLWRTFYRRGCKDSYSRVEQTKTDADKGNLAKSLLIEHQNPPPMYEDAAKEVKSAD